MSDFSLLQKILTEHKTFLITTHVNPDADAIGSELAVYRILKKIGAKARIVNHSATPYNLEFMDTERVIEKFDPVSHQNIFNEVDVFILLDLNQASRIVKMESGLSNFKGLKICIDHHQNPEPFYDHFFGGSEYSATGEIIFNFIKETGIVEIDYEIAFQLYTAIMTDTGSFRFERTSARIHRIIAELLETGINPTRIYDQVFDQFNFGRIKLLGETLSTITLDETGQIALMQITKKMLENNKASEADIDGFVNYCLSIKGVKIAILIYELNDGIKISFRSKGEVRVNKLAARFNGGGHSNAAGARMFNTTIEDIKDIVVREAQNILKN